MSDVTVEKQSDEFVRRFKKIVDEFGLDDCGSVYYEILYDYSRNIDRIFVSYAKYEENDLASKTELYENELDIYHKSLRDAGTFAGPVLFAWRARREWPCYNIFERIGCQQRINRRHPLDFFEKSRRYEFR